MAGNYLIALRQGDVLRKLCRVIYGSDGSYYVTCPYHPARKAIAFLATINYEAQTQVLSLDQAVDVAEVDDPDLRLKLAHHPDGFIQLSGQGIISGRDENGNPKGLGIMSWPLDSPVRGPAVGVTIHGVEHFDQEERQRPGTVIFEPDDVPPVPGATHLSVEGYYFPALWRRFVYLEAGHPYIRILHPAGAVLRLRALLPPPSATRQGFLGVEVYEDTGGQFDSDAAFALSSSTGNLRRTPEGTLGDALYCVYPRGDGRPAAYRSLRYELTPEPQRLAMPQDDPPQSPARPEADGRIGDRLGAPSYGRAAERPRAA